MKHGLLLINLGTPDQADVRSVRRYLRQFLADKRVITLPALIRYILLYGFILPFRPRRTAQAYQSIWTSHGSPLLYNSEAFTLKLQAKLGNDYKVALGMRYGSPSLAEAIENLRYCEHITILPLFPQYSSAATGSAIAKAIETLAQNTIIPSFQVIRDFHQTAGYIKAQANLIKPYVTTHDFILFSFHGVPANHLLIDDCKLKCNEKCSSHSALNHGCYRAQCLRTTNLLAKTLSLKASQYRASFQSRLGKTPWITPYTDRIMEQLATQGVKRLAIACPSFVADCLETLEEIGLRAKEQWHELGGEKFTLIPSLNDDPLWVDAVATQLILYSNSK